mgnify:CR=1 FL=1
MIGFARSIDNGIEPLRKLANKGLSPLLDLTIRLYMANIFFASGRLKLDNYLNNDWGSTVFLFEEIHPVPGIPAETAAIMGTGGEIILPILLAFGLFGRFAAGGLLALTAVIQFAVPADYGVSNPEHYLWMLLLAVPFLKGPGAISLDYLLLKGIRK